MEEIEKFISGLNGMSKQSVKITTTWATVKSVNWEEKTMTAIGLLDDLEYHEVLLGLGSVFIKPIEGSDCLLGMIENKDAAQFLIMAEKVEEMLVNSEKITFNEGENNGLVKVEPLKSEMSKMYQNTIILKTAALQLATTLEAIVPGTIAAFNATISGMTTQDLTTIENVNIKH
jgi:hypothetical protein